MIDNPLPQRPLGRGPDEIDPGSDEREIRPVLNGQSHLVQDLLLHGFLVVLGLPFPAVLLPRLVRRLNPDLLVLKRQ